VVTADAAETVLCVWLSAILLVGLGANARVRLVVGRPARALGVVYVAACEGIEQLSAARQSGMSK
jgi:hypothetical protein